MSEEKELDKKDQINKGHIYALTTEHLYREMSSLEEKIDAKRIGLMESIKHIVEGEIGILRARLDAMDKVFIIFSDNLTRVPTETDKQVGHLRDLHSERFEAIRVQFSERDTRADQYSRDNRIAIDAALQAAKDALSEQNKCSSEAIRKSELGFQKQIDQQAAMINTIAKAQDDRYGDLKERIAIIEASAAGRQEEKKDTHAGSSLLISIVSIVIAIISIISGVIVALVIPHK